MPQPHLAILALLALVASIASGAHADDDPLKVGMAAPPLPATSANGGFEPAALTWEALRGRHVIIDLWATWCAPCIPALAKLSEQAERFADRQVRFVAVTNEKPDTVARHLAKRPVSPKLWMAIVDHTTFQSYGVPPVPRTVIVDPQGKVMAIAHPNEVTDELVEALLAGKAVELGGPSKDIKDTKDDKDVEGQASLRPVLDVPFVL